ncbi:MAG: glycosyltransferase [Pseudomonadota bacterium]
MTEVVTALAALAVVIWVGLLFFRYDFWRGRQRLGRPQQDLVGVPSVTALIPARNEEETIAQTIASIRGQNYPGDLRILLVDDQSEDKTVARAKAAGLFDLRVLRTPDLPDGWSGKLWALETGWAAIAKGEAQPDYIWLSDADIVHEPEVLTALVTKSQARQSALTSLMVRLHARGFWGGLLIPAFVYYFQLIYPFSAVNDPSNQIAGAAGGCVLLERDWLKRIGGFAPLKDALIDDCTLARIVQKNGGRLWLGHGTASQSLRDNRSLGSVWLMVRRTAYAQLSHNPVLLIGCLLGLVLTFVLPWALLAAGLVIQNWAWAGLGGFAASLMMLSYIPTLRLYNQSIWRAIMLPWVTCLYGAMTIHSALAYYFGAGSSWKGRAYGR